MRLTLTIVVLLAGSSLAAQEEAPDQARAEKISLAKLVDTLQRSATQTLGGTQFWSDVRFFRGWRIQRNVFSGHHRLLDPDQHRAAHGTFQECESALSTVREKEQLESMSGRAVILIHGLIRSSRSFASMAHQLESDECTVVRFDYPSTRSSIPDAAACLAQVIQSLDGIETIDFVVHSMGGIVLRTYLRDCDDPRIRRAVLLGVPNHGAMMADKLRDNPLFRMIYGPAGQQLTSDAEGLIAELPVPEFEFGVIAGGRGGMKGYNPLLRGDNDSTVTVRSARLSGARDFLLVPVIHSFLMSDRRCVQAVRNFLATGQFAPSTDPQPIP